MKMHSYAQNIQKDEKIALYRPEGFQGGPWPLGGDPNSTKIGSRRDLKLHIFGAEGGENLEKMKVFNAKLTFNGVLRENLAK